MSEAVPAKQGSVLMGMIWMIVLSLLLFWLPSIGPLIAGIVGGKRAGGVGPGLLAALLPSVLLAGGLTAFLTLVTAMPLIGLVAGMGTFFLLLLEIAPLLIGALVGGLLAKS